MGDIADMMLEGILDEETGEYIGDINEEKYGTSAPGFPISYERENRKAAESKPKKTKLPCPVCNKKIKAAGLSMHLKAVHGLV